MWSILFFEWQKHAFPLSDSHNFGDLWLTICCNFEWTEHILLVTKMLFVELPGFECRLIKIEALCSRDCRWSLSDARRRCENMQPYSELLNTRTKSWTQNDLHSHTPPHPPPLSSFLSSSLFAQAHVIPCINVLLWYLHKHSCTVEG